MAFQGLLICLFQFALTERNFCRVPPVDNFFNVYQHGSRMLQNADQVTNLPKCNENKIFPRKSLKKWKIKSDISWKILIIFVDSKFSQTPILALAPSSKSFSWPFSQFFSKYILQYLNEECPKSPVFQYAFNNEHYASNLDGKQNEKVTFEILLSYSPTLFRYWKA